MADYTARSFRFLGERGKQTVQAFLTSRQNGDGGFCGRSAASDLYYTLFALSSLSAFGDSSVVKAASSFCALHGVGEDLDFVHFVSLIRSSALLARLTGVPDPLRMERLRRLDRYRATDGGYAQKTGAERSSLYGNFLALLALEDMGAETPETERLVAAITALRTSGGGFANDHTLSVGNTPATAAAVVMLTLLGQKADARALEWLMSRRHRKGGFTAGHMAPFADLLSTATALFAFRVAGCPIHAVREASLDFVESQWTEEGGFCGGTMDRRPDCEYTYYGLLALGCLDLGVQDGGR